jgi:hypothetical protein
VYYTALINNDGSTVPAYESEVEPPFEFKEDRKVALLEKPEEYEVCVQNSRISLKSLPVFIPSVVLPLHALVFASCCFSTKPAISGFSMKSNVLNDLKYKVKALGVPSTAF